MNKNKRNAKILTSLQERSVKTKMSKDDKHFTIDVMSRGKDGKKGTDDDKLVRKKNKKPIWWKPSSLCIWRWGVRSKYWRIFKCCRITYFARLRSYRSFASS